MTVSIWVYFWAFSPIPLTFESVFVPEPNYFDYYSLKSGSMIPLALFFLRIVSAILGLLYFHINFKIICSISVKSSSVLNKSGKYGNPYPVPDLRGDAFSFSPLSTMMAVCLSYMALIMLRFVPSQEKTTHGHHQMVNTKIRLIISLQPEMEKLYTVSKNKTKS